MGLRWTELKRVFPDEAAQYSLHRAVRGLLDRGLIYEQRIGDRRYVGLTARGDTDLRDLCDGAFAQLKSVCKARGVAVPPISAMPLPKKPSFARLATSPRRPGDR